MSRRVDFIQQETHFIRDNHPEVFYVFETDQPPKVPRGTDAPSKGNARHCSVESYHKLIKKTCPERLSFADYCSDEHLKSVRYYSRPDPAVVSNWFFYIHSHFLMFTFRILCLLWFLGSRGILERSNVILNT